MPRVGCPGDRRQQAIRRDERRAARVHEQEAAGAIGVLGHARLETCLAEQRRLLVAGDAGDRYLLAAEHRHRTLASPSIDGTISGSTARGMRSNSQHRLVPVAGREIQQQRATRVGGVGDVAPAAASASRRASCRSCRTRVRRARRAPWRRRRCPATRRVSCPKNTDPAASPCACATSASRPSSLHARAHVGSAPVLPDDGRCNRPPAAAIPQHRGFALVGDADRDDVRQRRARSRQHLGDRRGLGCPDFLGVVLDPA